VSRHLREVWRHSRDVSRHSRDVSRHLCDVSRHVRDVWKHVCEGWRHLREVRRHLRDVWRHLRASLLVTRGSYRNSTCATCSRIRHLAAPAELLTALLWHTAGCAKLRFQTCFCSIQFYVYPVEVLVNY